jgi:hypothetical protein
MRVFWAGFLTLGLIAIGLSAYDAAYETQPAETVTSGQTVTALEDGTPMPMPWPTPRPKVN